MTDSKSGKDLHAKDLPKDESERKRQSEGDLVETVAGAMGGAAIAAVTGKKRRKP